MKRTATRCQQVAERARSERDLALESNFCWAVSAAHVLKSHAALPRFLVRTEHWNDKVGQEVGRQQKSMSEGARRHLRSGTVSTSRQHQALLDSQNRGMHTTSTSTPCRWNRSWQKAWQEKQSTPPPPFYLLNLSTTQETTSSLTFVLLLCTTSVRETNRAAGDAMGRTDGLGILNPHPRMTPTPSCVVSKWECQLASKLKCSETISRRWACKDHLSDNYYHQCHQGPSLQKR